MIHLVLPIYSRSVGYRRKRDMWRLSLYRPVSSGCACVAQRPLAGLIDCIWPARHGEILCCGTSVCGSIHAYGVQIPTPGAGLTRLFLHEPALEKAW